MLIVAVIDLAVNGISMQLLTWHKGHILNVNSSYLEAWTDMS